MAVIIKKYTQNWPTEWPFVWVSNVVMKPQHASCYVYNQEYVVWHVEDMFVASIAWKQFLFIVLAEILSPMWSSFRFFPPSIHINISCHPSVVCESPFAWCNAQEKHLYVPMFRIEWFFISEIFCNVKFCKET